MSGSNFTLTSSNNFPPHPASGSRVKRGAGEDGRESLTSEDTHGGLRRAGLREEDQ